MRAGYLGRRAGADGGLGRARRGRSDTIAAELHRTDPRMPETTLLRTPLYDRHAALGARLVPFAGWEMPIQYSGIIAEHQAVRNAAGLFDVSHMGEFEVRGDDAIAFVDRITTNAVPALPQGGVQYSLLLKPDGGIVDDLLVYRLEGRLLLVVNAANIEKDLAWVLEHAPRGVTV